MSAEENKALIRRFFEEGLSAGNLAIVEELASPDLVVHGLAPGLPPGLAGFKQLLGMFRAGFPDYHDTVEELLAEGDKVVARWRFHGSHRGDFLGVPPSGRQVTTTGISLFRLAGGQIVEDWTQIDLLGLLQQLGAVPAPGQAG